MTYTQAALACPKIFLRWVGLSMIVRRDILQTLYMQQRCQPRLI